MKKKEITPMNRKAWEKLNPEPSTTQLAYLEWRIASAKAEVEWRSSPEYLIPIKGEGLFGSFCVAPEQQACNVLFANQWLKREEDILVKYKKGGMPLVVKTYPSLFEK